MPLLWLTKQDGQNDAKRRNMVVVSPHKRSLRAISRSGVANDFDRVHIPFFTMRRKAVSTQDDRDLGHH